MPAGRRRALPTLVPLHLISPPLLPCDVLGLREAAPGRWWCCWRFVRPGTTRTLGRRPTTWQVLPT